MCSSYLKAIRVVECPEFRDLCMLLRESLNDKDIPRRDKVREAIIQQFEKEFACLKVELSVGWFVLVNYYTNTFTWQESVGRISLTTDIWSSQSLRFFLALTADWIGQKNSKLELRAALIGFHMLKKRHTGRNIAKTILHLLERASIEKKASLL